MGVCDLGDVNLVKYQLESTNVSIVSVSLNASPPHSGHLHIRQVSCLSSGLPGLSNLTSSGSFIGRFSFFSATSPQLSQWTTGIGHPQYLCLLSPQSRSRYFVTPFPQPCFSAKRIVSSIASAPVATSTPVKWFTHLTRSDLGGTYAISFTSSSFSKE